MVILINVYFMFINLDIHNNIVGYHKNIGKPRFSKLCGKGNIMMNENDNNNMNTEQNGLSGFDSVSNITPGREGEFHPTPMFSGMNGQKKEGYTVTPEGNYFTHAVGGTDRPQTDAADTAPAQEPEIAAPASAQTAPEAAEPPTQAAAEPQTAEPQPQQDTAAHDFIPSGTYSYSAAKGNMPSGAFQTAEIPGGQPPEEPIFMPPVPPVPPVRNKVKKEKKYGAGVVITSAVLAALIGAGGGIGAMYFTGTQKAPQTSETASASSPQSVTNITVDETVNSTVEAVAKKAGPSIIGIRTTAADTSFFGGSSEATEEGSGIVYSSDGYIITNYHVIESAVESSNSKVEVFLPEDTKTAIGATIVGYNIASDLAVVKINKTGLAAIEFADSNQLSVGQYAIAIGNPGGLEFIGSVSSGVISGLNRSVTVGTGSTMSLIQTDAAINPGNSGGALVNTKGQLIGVNSVKLVSESYEGLGFAIPSNTVKEICDNIIAKQNEPTPYIGIQISQNYTADQLSALGYPAGAVVVSVIEGGPASESGIQRGDIITEFNGVTISGYADLDSAVSNCKPGDSVTVKLYRAGRFYSTNVNVEANNAQ